MKLSDLNYDFSEELIATTPQRPSRIMWVDNGLPSEITKKELLSKFQSGDVLVINETKVSKRRIFAQDFEILFLEKVSAKKWKVLFPASRLKRNEKIFLPDNIEMNLLESGLPQLVELSEEIDELYFEKYGEVPLPPYIQKARHNRHHLHEDERWYQTAWAKKVGSQAAPTASLHFDQSDLDFLISRGVFVEKILLHVGLGTFLPVKVEDLSQHIMHFEEIFVSAKTWDKLLEQKKQHKKIWCLGTTVTRTLESCAYGKVCKNSAGDFEGRTDLFIKDDFDFQMTDVLLTNFHQPQTTLLALVAAFAGLENVKKCYKWAIERKFRLFSYGDLTVWLKSKND